MLISKDILLFFLSCVIFESQTSDVKEKEERKIIEDGAGIDDADHMRSSNIQKQQPQQQLEHKWTLWYERKSHGKANKGLKKDDYLKEVKKAGSFQTIPAFWKCWSNLQELRTVPIAGQAANYHLFKDNIKPLWEDPKNIKGGKWTFVLPSNTAHSEIMKNWMSLMLTLLLGDLGCESEINGAVLSVRTWGSMFSIWNRNASDRILIENVSLKLKDLFSVDSVKYQRHQITMRRNIENSKYSRPKEEHYFSDNSSSDEATFSDGEKEKPKRISSVNDQPENSQEFLEEEKIGIVENISTSSSQIDTQNDLPTQIEMNKNQVFSNLERELIQEYPEVDEEGAHTPDAAKNRRRRKIQMNGVKDIQPIEKLTPHQNILIVKPKEVVGIDKYTLIFILVVGITLSVISWVLYL